MATVKYIDPRIGWASAGLIVHTTGWHCKKIFKVSCQFVFYFYFSQLLVDLKTKVGGSWGPKDQENESGCEDWPSYCWDN